jgi:hypothetical protein
MCLQALGYELNAHITMSNPEIQPMLAKISGIQMATERK